MISPVKPMKAFTHGFTDAVDPKNALADHAFFVKGEKFFCIIKKSNFILAAWSKFYGTEYDVLLVDWHPLANGKYFHR